MTLFNRITDNEAVKALGPGLITGAADDDPSGIATYSQAGAQFGFNMLWTLVLTYPLMVGIQLVSARIGLVTGRGLAANIRRAYSPWLLYSIVLLLLAANIINIAADIAAMGEALRPIAGEFAFFIFAMGILGTGLLAVPVLAGSAAYAVTESFRWSNGLDLKALEAREYYPIISLATIGGMALNYAPIDPIKALIWSAQINGVIAVPIMIVMMLLAHNKTIMGSFTLSRRHTVIGWIGVAVMLVAVVAMFATM